MRDGQARGCRTRGAWQTNRRPCRFRSFPLPRHPFCASGVSANCCLADWSNDDTAVSARRERCPSDFPITERSSPDTIGIGAQSPRACIRRQEPMTVLSFSRNDRPTLGVEVELQLVDARTGALRSAIEDVLSALPAALDGQVKPELMQCYLEINTNVCETVAEAGEDLRSKIA